MDPQISVFLLFILFTAGHSLSCYDCKGLTGSCAEQWLKTCPSGFSQCLSATNVVQIGFFSFKVKFKDCFTACQNGSLNLGFIKSAISCCDTDECNLRNARDPSNIPNGRTCYYCDIERCSNTLSCYGDEDRCINATWTFGGRSMVVKGCASKSFCDGTEFDLGVLSVSCCEGNLCNGAQRLNQRWEF